jgi:BASS family bile acid:Na+ symporter
MESVPMDGPLVQIVLPLVLMFMMVTMGLNLTVDDFKRVATRPKAFFTGAVNQMVLLPLVTFAVATDSGLEPTLAAGFMILAASPGGITSNVLTHFARGDLALSITLTAVVSLLGFVTIPLIVGFGLDHFLAADDAVSAPAEVLAGSVFALTILPVGLGMLVRRFNEALAFRIEPLMNKVSAVLFVIVVIGAVAANWALFVANLGTLGVASLVLCVTMMSIGFGTARLVQLDERQAVSISIETGVQNATMGLLIGTTILGDEALALPSAIYGVVMYLPASLFLLLLRRRTAGLEQAA